MIIRIQKDDRVGEYETHILINDDRSTDISVVMTTFESYDLTKHAVLSFLKFKNDVTYKIYLVDNFSRQDTVDKLIDFSRNENVNLILNRKSDGTVVSMLNGTNGSYLNGLGIQTGVNEIDSNFAFICHNDVLAYSDGWLDHLFSKLGDDVKGASFSQDTIRIRAMHMSGYLLDWNYYRSSDDVFWFPKWDNGNMLWDAADHPTKHIREDNKKYHVCHNTFNEKHLLENLRDEMIDKYNIHADKSLDDNGKIMYLHLGRGLLKSENRYNKPGRTYHREWIEFCKDVLGEDFLRQR